jgi:hypothetical protein
MTVLPTLPPHDTSLPSDTALLSGESRAGRLKFISAAEAPGPSNHPTNVPQVKTSPSQENSVGQFRYALHQNNPLKSTRAGSVVDNVGSTHQARSSPYADRDAPNHANAERQLLFVSGTSDMTPPQTSGSSHSQSPKTAFEPDHESDSDCGNIPVPWILPSPPASTPTRRASPFSRRPTLSTSSATARDIIGTLKSMTP